MKFNYVSKDNNGLMVMVYYRDPKGVIGKRDINKYSKLPNWYVCPAMGLNDANRLLNLLTK